MGPTGFYFSTKVQLGKSLVILRDLVCCSDSGQKRRSYNGEALRVQGVSWVSLNYGFRRGAEVLCGVSSEKVLVEE